MVRQWREWMEFRSFINALEKRKHFVGQDFPKKPLNSELNFDRT